MIGILYKNIIHKFKKVISVQFLNVTMIVLVKKIKMMYYYNDERN